MQAVGSTGAAPKRLCSLHNAMRCLLWNISSSENILRHAAHQHEQISIP